MPAILGSGLVLAAHSEPRGAGLSAWGPCGAEEGSAGMREGGHQARPPGGGQWGLWLGEAGDLGNQEAFDENLEQSLRPGRQRRGGLGPGGEECGAEGWLPTGQ